MEGYYEKALNTGAIDDISEALDETHEILIGVLALMGFSCLWLVILSGFILWYFIPHRGQPGKEDSGRISLTRQRYLEKDEEKLVTELTLQLALGTDMVKEVREELKVIARKNGHERKDIDCLIKKMGNFLKGTMPNSKGTGHLHESNMGFYHKLRALHPELTEHELKLCGLIRLGMTTKEIAVVNNVTMKAIEMAKYRLKKKINLDNTARLDDYVYQID